MSLTAVKPVRLSPSPVAQQLITISSCSRSSSRLVVAIVIVADLYSVLCKGLSSSSSSSLFQATRPIAQYTIKNSKNTNKDRQEKGRNKNIQTSYSHNMTRCFTIKLLQQFHRCRNRIRLLTSTVSKLGKFSSNNV